MDTQEPQPVMVSRGLCLAASHDTSCDSLFTVLALSPVKPTLVDSLFAVLALNALKPWLDRHPKESQHAKDV